MKRSILSEKGLVVIMFIMVVVVFSFAQADSRDIEKRFFNSTSTTTPDYLENTVASLKTTGTKQDAPSVHLR